jgi:hypothetical protein
MMPFKDQRVFAVAKVGSLGKNKNWDEGRRKEKNHHIFSSLPRADEMPGPPWEGQLMCTLFLSTHQ